MSRRDSLARAMAGHDKAFEARLVDEIAEAIADTSLTADPDGHQVLALRLGETPNALTTVLASTLALSPSSARSSKSIKQIAIAFREKLRAQVAAAERNGLFADVRARSFGSDSDDRQRGGNA